MKAALQQVGLKPTTARQMMARNLVLFNTQEQLENTIDGVFEPLTKLPRKILFQRAGGFYRARFEGDAMSTIGDSRKEATRRLQFWGGQ
jgi:hypothetical protein